MFDPISEANGIHLRHEYRVKRRLELEAGRVERKVTLQDCQEATRLAARQLGDVFQIPESKWIGSTVFYCVGGPWYEDFRGGLGQSVRLEYRADGWWLVEINREELACSPQKAARASTVLTVGHLGRPFIREFENPPINLIEINWKGGDHVAGNCACPSEG